MRCSEVNRVLEEHEKMTLKYDEAIRSLDDSDTNQ